MFLRYLLILLFCLSSCVLKPTDWRKTIGSKYDLDLSAAVVEYEYDDHRGFTGDGQSLVIFDCPEDFDHQLDDYFKPLPLPEEQSIILYGNDEWSSLIELRDHNADLIQSVPVIEHGCYYFNDRQESELPVLERDSFNFDIMIYDSDSHKLYYGSLDT